MTDTKRLVLKVSAPISGMDDSYNMDIKFTPKYSEEISEGFKRWFPDFKDSMPVNAELVWEEYLNRVPKTNRISRDEMFMEICQTVAKRSTCLRSKVGALIVKEGRIISMGYNGPVSGAPECEALPEIEEFPTVGDFLGFRESHKNTLCEGPGCTRSIHAEANAIIFAAKTGVSVNGCTLYCSMSPCTNCAKLIVNSGIAEVKYKEEYRESWGLKFLEKHGVKVTKV